MAISKKEESLSGFVAGVAKGLDEAGRVRTARAYLTALRRFLGSLGVDDLPLDAITDQLMHDFEEFLRKEGLKANTISFYMRNLRAIYNKAVKARLIDEPEENPFAKVYTGTAPTEKRAVSMQEMQELNLLATCVRPNGIMESGIVKPGTLGAAQHESLLLFLFSFHACGMSFVDLCYLRKNNVKGKEILYYRKKTGGLMNVPITQPMREILGYFTSATPESSPYVFPILKEESAEREYKDYMNALGRQNQHLKLIGKQAGLEKTLSTHVARHSWATIAHHMQKPLAMISQALGHKNETVTSIYLASFNAADMRSISEEVSNLIGKAPTD